MLNTVQEFAVNISGHHCQTIGNCTTDLKQTACDYRMWIEKQSNILEVQAYVISHNNIQQVGTSFHSGHGKITEERRATIKDSLALSTSSLDNSRIQEVSYTSPSD